MRTRACTQKYFLFPFGTPARQKKEMGEMLLKSLKRRYDLKVQNQFIGNETEGTGVPAASETWFAFEKCVTSSVKTSALHCSRDRENCFKRSVTISREAKGKKQPVEGKNRWLYVITRIRLKLFLPFIHFSGSEAETRHMLKKNIQKRI